MIKCPICNELQGDGATKCYRCGHCFSEEDRRDAIIRKKRLQAEADAKAEFAKRVRLGIITSIVVFIVCLLGTIVYTIGHKWGLAIVVIALIIYAFCFYKYRFWHCPYCESFVKYGLWEMLHGTHCIRCGRKLK